MSNIRLALMAFSVAGAIPLPHGGVASVGNTPVEMTASVEKLSIDAMSGNALAASKLSDYFRYEKNDQAKWAHWALIAAENGNARSQFDVYNSLGMSDDQLQQRRAYYWLKKSAQGGDLNANLELKRCFPTGNFEPHTPGCLGSNAH